MVIAVRTLHSVRIIQQIYFVTIFIRQVRADTDILLPFALTMPGMDTKQALFCRYHRIFPFLGHEAGIVRSRGHWFEWEGIPVMPTYHPAYLLRQYGRDLVKSKWDVYYDLKEAKERAAAAAPDWVWQSETPPNLMEEFAAVRAARHRK